jgi:hypothetical protein
VAACFDLITPPAYSVVVSPYTPYGAVSTSFAVTLDPEAAAFASEAAAFTPEATAFDPEAMAFDPEATAF